LGHVQDVIFVIVFTIRKNRTKIISDRKANKIERKDNQIDYSDIPETDTDFWKDAKIVLPKVKTAIEIDQDLALWIKNFKDRNLTISELKRI
jgi:hypothetical protein